MPSGYKLGIIKAVALRATSSSSYDEERLTQLH